MDDGKRILVACHEIAVAGGLYRFERFGRAIERWGHGLAFLAFADAPQQIRQTDFPVLTLAEAAETRWDATHVPGAGFPDTTIDQFALLKAASFGVRVQHILNDTGRRSAFRRVNSAFSPHVVVFNNRRWQLGEFTDFSADAFHFLEGAVDIENLRPDTSRRFDRQSQPFVVGGLTTKNVGPLLEAVRPDDIHLHLFGPTGDLEEGARDLVEAGRLKLFGVLSESDLPVFFASIDCVVHTETGGGWANLAAEGMASGHPVICTPHGVTAFAEHGQTALIVNEPSARNLAEAILKLRDDPVLARSLAHRGRQRIEDFSWPQYSAELLQLSRRPALSYYAASPELGLFGKWPESQRLEGLQPILQDCSLKTVLDLGSAEGLVSRRLLDRGAAGVHGFERDAGRVALANGICADFPGACFRQADLSDWTAFEAQHRANLQDSYDIVLHLGLHHHLPETSRMQVLMEAAKRSSDWLAVRTTNTVFARDRIEEALDELGFYLSGGKTSLASFAGDVYRFRRRT